MIKNHAITQLKVASKEAISKTWLHAPRLTSKPTSIDVTPPQNTNFLSYRSTVLLSALASGPNPRLCKVLRSLLPAESCGEPCPHTWFLSKRTENTLYTGIPRPPAWGTDLLTNQMVVAQSVLLPIKRSQTLT